MRPRHNLVINVCLNIISTWGVDRGVSADGGARGQKGSIWGVLDYAVLAR